MSHSSFSPSPDDDAARAEALAAQRKALSIVAAEGRPIHTVRRRGASFAEVPGDCIGVERALIGRAPSSRPSFGLGGRTWFLSRALLALPRNACRKSSVARHLCGNALCCNPGHVRVGTAVENMADARRHGAVRVPALAGVSAGRRLSRSQVLAVFRDPRRAFVVAREYGVSREAVCAIRRGVVGADLVAAAPQPLCPRPDDPEPGE